MIPRFPPLKCKFSRIPAGGRAAAGAARTSRGRAPAAAARGAARPAPRAGARREK